jgi:hypothetical protein
MRRFSKSLFVDFGANISNQCLYETPNGFLFNSSSIRDEISLHSPNLTKTVTDGWLTCQKKWNPVPMMAWGSSKLSFINKTMIGIKSTLLQFFVAKYTSTLRWTIEGAITTHVALLRCQN